MTFIAPPYRKTVLLMQLFIVILFSFALYFFLYSLEEKKELSEELTNTMTKHKQVIQLADRIERYSKIVNNDAVLRGMTREPTWEKVEFTWGSLDLTELLARIYNLSRQKKIFVLESFEAGFRGPVMGEVSATRSQGGKIAKKERFFHIQGYFLCP